MVRASSEGWRCEGAWTLDGIIDLDQRLRSVQWPPGALQLDGSMIHALDTIGALQLRKLIAELERSGHGVRLTGLREKHQALLDLVCKRLIADGSVAAPEQRTTVLEQLGRQAVHSLHRGFAFLVFVGEAATALGRLTLQPRRFRWRALFANLETAGVNALPIIALLSFMIGVVIAYQGGQQLKFYGANIFIVELVSLTMLRELAPLITAIIVAGRTGSSYTAQIGTMQVTEEVDALRTIGIPPMDLLVLPKLLALTIALPLLTVFADALSVFGGMFIAQVMLDVNFQDFLDRFPKVVTLTSFLLGVGKAPVFAAIIALVGCYQGFQVRGGADSVGRQTTVSVVQSIFLVIAADALFSILLGGVGL
ncbi:MAG: ABC transporter permease [Candidatus Competibacteraceae bacterium]|nr:ABC transporter permease [Candidatus Competibacteraceae bacterium]MCP5126401.1 ABC transporter permease [Gammaproteobacteria bacterium]HRX70681.1 ABC transporter permease [Candidatus Competibacteraceae bacterium]